MPAEEQVSSLRILRAETEYVLDEKSIHTSGWLLRFLRALPNAEIDSLILFRNQGANSCKALIHYQFTQFLEIQNKMNAIIIA